MLLSTNNIKANYVWSSFNFDSNRYQDIFNLFNSKMLSTSRSVARASRSSYLSNFSSASTSSSVRCFSCSRNQSSVNDVLNRISTASSSQRQQAQSQSRPVQAAAAIQSSTSQLPLKTPSSPIQDSSSPSGRTPSFRNGQVSYHRIQIDPLDRKSGGT